MFREGLVSASWLLSFGLPTSLKEETQQNSPLICGPWSSMWLDIRLDLAMMALWHTVPWCKIEERKNEATYPRSVFLHIPNQICFKNWLFLGFLLKAGDELYWTSIVNGFIYFVYNYFSQPTIPNPPDSFCCRIFMVEVLREHFPRFERFRKEGRNDVTQPGGGRLVLWLNSEWHVC